MAAGQEVIGQENLRFLANFNDVFITLGLVILFIGVSTMVGMIATPALIERQHPGRRDVGALGRRRTRLGAAGIFLRPAAPAAAQHGADTDLHGLHFAGRHRIWLRIRWGSGSSLMCWIYFGTTGRLGVTAFLAAAAAASAIYLRFRLPFSLAVIALGRGWRDLCLPRLFRQ